eukprot:362182-Chlamydomonas_euryale.AAC.9
MEQRAEAASRPVLGSVAVCAGPTCDAVCVLCLLVLRVLHPPTGLCLKPRTGRPGPLAVPDMPPTGSVRVGPWVMAHGLLHAALPNGPVAKLSVCTLFVFVRACGDAVDPAEHMEVIVSGKATVTAKVTVCVCVHHSASVCTAPYVPAEGAMSWSMYGRHPADKLSDRLTERLTGSLAGWLAYFCSDKHLESMLEAPASPRQQCSLGGELPFPLSSD